MSTSRFACWALKWALAVSFTAFRPCNTADLFSFVISKSWALGFIDRFPPISLPFAPSCLMTSISTVKALVKFLLLRQRRNRTFPDLPRTFMHIPPHAVLLKSAAKAGKRFAAEKKKTFHVISIQTLLQPVVYKVISHFVDAELNAWENITSELWSFAKDWLCQFAWWIFQPMKVM